MAPRRDSSSYARDATVHIETGSDATAALDRALEAAGFLGAVDLARAASGKASEQFRIAIKPNLVSEAGTDPALVEHLIGKLHQRDYTELALVESRTNARRGVLDLAAAAGYSGNGYRIVDLSDEQVPFDYAGVLGEATAGRTWVEADYRVSFAKAKTRRRCFYSATLANLFGCLPQPDKLTWYAGPRHAYYECCVLIADRLPVHFALVDASQLEEILASANPFALDWVVGEKMELDPSLNPVLQEALLRWGRIHVTREGNLTAWAPWRNVRPITVAALELLEPFYRGPMRRLGGRRLSEWTVQ